MVQRDQTALRSPSTQSTQLKQKSIAGFFKTVPANGAVHDHQSTRQTSATSIEDLVSKDTDEHIEQDTHVSPDRNAENDQFMTWQYTEDGPQAKRRKTGNIQQPQEPIATRSTYFPSQGPTHTAPSTLNAQGHTRTVSERTSRYLFASSPPAEGSAAEHAQDTESEEVRKQKLKIHESFVRKLGGANSLALLKRQITEPDAQFAESGSEAEVDDEEERPGPKPKLRGRKQPASRKDKYTPLERQVIDIKRSNPDTLLIIEVGYKFRFFGEDARSAAKELSIVCIPGKYRFDEHPSEAHLDRFASASVPVHRLHVHVKRLVSAGHKVGVVRQLETAALKAAGANRNSAFERGLTNLYTKGTYIDDQEGLESVGPAEPGTVSATGHLLCLTETFPKGWGTDEKVQIGFVAVQPATGDIVYDDFEDGWLRSELETRLLHIAPCEFLIVGDITRATEKLLEHLTASRSNVFGDRARIERVDKPRTMAAQAHSHLTKFYADKMKTNIGESSDTGIDKGALLDKVHKLSENATICLSAMIKHLSSYKLEHVFDLTKYFQSFSARSHMLINGNTLNSLEIFRNQTDLTTYGSLFWALDRTQTRFGQRLLRKWLARPLLDRSRLSERVAAVEELREHRHSSSVTKLKALLARIKSDLERSLIRIYYRKCTRPELLAVLQTMQLIAQEYAHVESPDTSGFRSTLIQKSVILLPQIGQEVLNYLERINVEAAKSDDKYNFFRGEHETESIQDHKAGIVAVEYDLNEFRMIAAEKLKSKRVDYVTVAAIEYLIELENNNLKNVPASWMKISGTKKCSRYHAPEVIAFIRERDQHKEALANACDEAFGELLAEIGNQYQSFRDCVQALAQLDCLLSLAEVAAQPEYCKPEFTEHLGISIVKGRHPMAEQIQLNPFVPNDIQLHSDGTRALLVTGPNMGGKSSYVRSVALITIMAQCGSYVPAESATLGLMDAVFTRMGAFDNMMKKESTFMVELSETADILKQATPRSLVILDELGRGTSTHDGVAIAEAVLHHMVTQLKSFTLFITHYQSLTRMATRYTGELENVHMRFSEGDANDDETHDITFLYEIGEGVAHRSYGLNVAKLAGLPKSVIDCASYQSRQTEEKEVRQRLGHLAKTVASLINSHDEETLPHLITGIDQL